MFAYALADTSMRWEKTEVATKNFFRATGLSGRSATFQKQAVFMPAHGILRFLPCFTRREADRPGDYALRCGSRDK